MLHESLIDILRAQLGRAVAQVAGTAPGELDPLVRATADPQFGDYQCNVAMSLAKSLKAKPRAVAERIVSALGSALGDIAEPLEVAGPGFINIRLKPEFLGAYLGRIPEQPADAAQPDRCGLPPVEQPQRVVIDYSSPNIAKQMHVGHLRSTIVGDVFARVLSFEGHEVVRQNHVGDWGTQFGILIEHYRNHPMPTPATHDDVLQAIEDDYRAAQQRFEADEAFASAARSAVGRLQSGDLEARRVWEQICTLSRQAFLALYRRLNVLLEDGDVCGESFYNDRLAAVVAELRERLKPGAGRRAELREDQGAQCIFFYDSDGQPQYRNPEGQPLPMIVQKSDGAYLYATTDLAALRYRIRELGAQRVVYVTDARQKLHFEMLFAAARAAGWAGPDVRLEHVPFGSVLGPDRRPLKTRSGQNVKLRDLLDEAESRAYELLGQRESSAAPEAQEEGRGGAAAGFTEQEKREVARRVGVAAVKYADLRSDRTSDYVFTWDKMITFQGNTAPYMLYAYARIRSIYRKAAATCGSPEIYAPGLPISLAQPAERALGLCLARLRETIDAVATELEPHLLCGYLYDLAGEFMRFYEQCPVLQAPQPAMRLSRLRLCDLTARALKLGLALLGIETIERM